MKYLISAIAAGMLSACVSAPSELYGVHQAKSETSNRQAAHLAEVKPGSTAAGER